MRAIGIGMSVFLIVMLCFMIVSSIEKDNNHLVVMVVFSSLIASAFTLILWGI